MSIILYVRAKEQNGNLTFKQLVSTKVSIKAAGAEQLYQVMRMIEGLGNVLSPTYTRTEVQWLPWCKKKTSKVEEMFNHSIRVVNCGETSRLRICRDGSEM